MFPGSPLCIIWIVLLNIPRKLLLLTSNSVLTSQFWPQAAAACLWTPPSPSGECQPDHTNISGRKIFQNSRKNICLPWSASGSRPAPCRAWSARPSPCWRASAPWLSSRGRGGPRDSAAAAESGNPRPAAPPAGGCSPELPAPERKNI